MKISDNEKPMEFDFLLTDADKAIARFAMECNAKRLNQINAQDYSRKFDEPAHA